MTNSEPSSHFVMVNYNAGEWLARALSSVCIHGGANISISIVDNASVDNSVNNAKLVLEALPSKASVQWLENTQNLGFAAANNQILVHLESDFAVLMNPDCEINQNTLPQILQAFADHPRMGIASCRILNEDGSMQNTCRRRFPTPWSALVRMLQLHQLFPNLAAFKDFDYGALPNDDASSAQQSNQVEFIEAISGAFMVVRKSAMAHVGMLDEAYFMHCEDLDWCKRFQLQGWQVGFVPGASVVHAKGVSSASRPVRVLWTLHTGMLRFFDKFYKQRYPLLLRWLVKLGIMLSFIGRAALVLLRNLLPGRAGK